MANVLIRNFDRHCDCTDRLALRSQPLDQLPLLFACATWPPRLPPEAVGKEPDRHSWHRPLLHAARWSADSLEGRSRRLQLEPFGCDLGVNGLGFCPLGATTGRSYAAGVQIDALKGRSCAAGAQIDAAVGRLGAVRGAIDATEGHWYAPNRRRPTQIRPSARICWCGA